MQRSARDPAHHDGRWRWGAALAVCGLALVAYLATMARGLDYVDTGELAAVAWTLGVAHPTGYPTLTLIAHLWAHLVPLRPILALNLFAALLTAAGAGALVFLFDEALSAPPAALHTTPRAAGSPNPRPPAATRTACAALAALGTALSATWWEQALHYEVYSFHAWMLPLVTIAFLKFTRGGRGGPLFAYLLGLSFTNHMTTILLAPGFLAYFAMTRGVTVRELKRLARSAPWFALGLTPYLYLPVRSARGPRFDWGNPETLHNFLHHVMGRSYSAWIFSDPGAFSQQSRFFFGHLPAEAGFLGLPLSVAGLLWWRSRAPRLGVLAILLFATSVAFAGGYGIPDIRPYYLAAVMATGMGIAGGLAWLGQRFGARALVLVGVVWIAVVLAVNVTRLLPERSSPVEGLARDVLEPLPPRAVVFSNQWDQWTSASLYLQEVEGLRRDVTLIDSEALGRPWYVEELERRAPQLSARARPALEAVLGPAGRRGDKDEAPDREYLALVDALVSRSLEDRPVFVTRDAVPRLLAGYRTVPEGLAFRVVVDSADAPQEMPHWRFRPEQARRDMYGALTCELYARSALDRAYYEVGRGRDSTAIRYLDYARSFDPGWRMDQVPTQPWGASDVLARSLGFFDALGMLDLARLRSNARNAGLLTSGSGASGR